MVLLDRSTLMVVFAVMTLTMLVLFYFDTYRQSRAPFAGWWCGAVGSFFLAAAFYFMGEAQDVSWATSVGNGVMVLGSGCVWAGTRSLAGGSGPGCWGSRPRRPMPSMPPSAIQTWRGSAASPSWH